MMIYFFKKPEIQKEALLYPTIGVQNMSGDLGLRKILAIQRHFAGKYTIDFDFNNELLNFPQLGSSQYTGCP